MKEQLEKLKQALLGLSTYLKAKMVRDVPIVSPPTEKKSLLIPLANAIKSMEGFYPGSTSFRNSNPGNMKFSNYCFSLGATGKDERGFAIFPSYEVGFRALCQFIKDAANNELKIGKNLTIQTFINKYAPAEDNNNPEKYADFLQRSLGVSKNTLLKDIL